MTKCIDCEFYDTCSKAGISGGCLDESDKKMNAMKYINAEDLRNAMYQETFEKDSKMQKWESGCWIRYKLFENVLDKMPSADVVEVVRCKDCIWHSEKDNGDLFCEIKSENWGEPFAVKPEHYCSSGERRETE